MTCVAHLLALMKYLKTKSFCYLLQKIQKLKNLAVQINVRLIRNSLKKKFRENLPNSQKFRGPTQSGRSQGSQR